ncbi:hypothetical protein VNO77_02303 [Canavalia gladiata]|uniref:Uncharacterized protein n=1 Tax=Canavalia gladiata TaxID=3824 RepID=A0AAN9RB56_CANGL
METEEDTYVIIGDDLVRKKGNHLEKREKLGLTCTPKGQFKLRTPPHEPTNALEKKHKITLNTLYDDVNELDFQMKGAN